MIVVDTSALVALYLGEPEGPDFADIIDVADEVYISVISRVELVSVLCGRRVKADPQKVSGFIDGLNLTHVPVTTDGMARAIDALMRFGKGRHPAALNFGDCFAYALADELGAALLYKGDDLGRTGIAPAWPSAT